MNLASPPSAAHCGKTPESGFPGNLASEGGTLTPEHGLMRLFLGQELGGENLPYHSRGEGVEQESSACLWMGKTRLEAQEGQH